MEHNKISFAKEYCKCRKIPYSMRGETLVIGDYVHKYSTIYSVYNFTYSDLMNCIDNMVEYDPVTTYYKRTKIA